MPPRRSLPVQTRLVLASLFLTSLALLPLFPPPAAQSAERPPVFALLIGIQQYKHRGYSDLAYTKNDVEGLRDALTGYGGVPRRNVRTLLNEQATKAAIRKALTQWLSAELRRRANREATVILFFAGHGESHEGESYWLPYDVKKGKAHLEDTALSSTHVNGWLKKLNTSRVVIFTDACHSGAWSSKPGGRGRRRGARGKTSSKAFGSKDFGTGEGFIRISSSQQDQLSWEVDELQHGLFTYALIQGLKGAASRSRSGAVTVGTLMAYLEEEVEALSKKYEKELQRPVREGTSAGALPLSYPRSAPSPTAEPTTIRSEPAPTVAAVPPSPAAPTAERPAEPAPIITAVAPSPASPKAGDRQTFEAKGVTFAVRFIPAGSFTMGSPADEKQRDSDEGPQRTVRLSRAFWMLETEVTQGQYKALVGSNPSGFSSCGDTCPVEEVSWHDAAVFANTLSAQQNLPSCFTCKANGECDIPDKAAYLACKGWRLPTEAEWEYAARAGTTTRFHTGDCITPDQANFDGNHPPEGCSKGEDRGKTVVVGSFAANAWGLHDMHGNVLEWVADWYKETYDSNDLGDPLQLLGSEPRRRSLRVIRGGSWSHFGGRLRSAKRGRSGPAKRYGVLGFRLSRSR